MRKIYKVMLIIIIILVILITSFAIYMRFFRKQNIENTNKNNVVHTLKDYGYSLEDRDSELMKNEFNKLKEILENDEIDYSQYAQTLSKLFVIDVFTIDNKINKYDIGGLDYLLEAEKDKFKNILIDSVYSTVLDNSNNKRKQELPIVKNVTVLDVIEESYMLDKESKNCYIVKLSWEYETDLGYDSEAFITLVKEDNKLFIVEYNPEIETQEVSEQ